jgi:hypothetical protein
MCGQMRFGNLQKLGSGQCVEKTYRPGLIRTLHNSFLLLL